MDEPGRGRSLAEKLDRLFERIRRPDGQEFTYEEVATATQQNGEGISQSYVWQLRKGKKDNPTIKHVQALADFFGVAPAYFFDDAAEDRINQQLDALRLEQEKLRQITVADDIQLVAMRAGDLDPADRVVFAGLMEAVARDRRAQQARTSSDGRAPGDADAL